MKKNYPMHFLLGLILFTLLAPANLFAQGTCTSAHSIQELPYSGINLSNCGKGSHYAGSPACLESRYFSGEDYVFAYTPAADECINIGVQYINKKNGFSTYAGLALLNDCPDVPNASCYEVSTGRVHVNNDGALNIRNVGLKAKHTYYILVSGGQSSQGMNGCFDFNIYVENCALPAVQLEQSVKAPQASLLNTRADCGNNLGFENGTVNGWQGCHYETEDENCDIVNGKCVIKCDQPGLLPGPVNAPLGVCASNPGNVGVPRHVITSGTGFDPNTDNKVPVVAPGGGNNSVRIGNHEAGYQAECMWQTFTVTKENALFTYLYAVVFEDPVTSPHTEFTKPRFSITITGPDNKPVTCGGIYEVTSDNGATNGFETATGNVCKNTGAGVSNVYFKNWTPVTTNLKGYIGQQVTIKFCTADCGQGGHYGYAYIDTYCNPEEIKGVTICTGTNSATLTAPNGFKSYTWYNGGQPVSGTSIGTGQNITINNPADNSLYTVKMQLVADTNCYYYITDTIRVVNLVASGDTTICNGYTGNIQLKSNSNDPAAVYSWSSVPAGFTSSDPNPLVPAPTQTTVYNVSINTPLGCTVTQRVTVTVTNPAVPNFTAPPVCLNTATSFTDISTVSPGSSITSWEWDFGEPSSGVNNTSTLQNPSHKYSTAGTFTVKLTTTVQGGCKTSITLPVIVHPLPVVDFTAPDVCIGQPTNFTNLSTISGGSIASWSWIFGEPASGPNNISSLQNPTHTYASPGTYQVILTVTSDQGCQNTFGKPVIVHPPPMANFTGTNVCLGSPTQFTDLSTAANGTVTSWAWNFGDPASGASNTSTDKNPSHTYAAAGTYTVSLIVTSDKGCIDTATATVVVSLAAVPNFAANAVCLKNPTVFSDQSTIGSGNITSWIWEFGEPASGTANNSTLQNPTHTYATAGTFSVTLTVISDRGCTSKVTKPVVVHPVPVAAFTNTSVCVGTATDFKDESTIGLPGGIVAWTWHFGDNTTATQQHPSHTYANAGTYDVKLIVRSENGCIDSIQRSIIVHAIPVVHFGPPASGCKPVCVQFWDSSSVANGTITSWLWDFGDGQTSTQPKPYHCYTQEGNYTVTLKVTSNGGCTETKTIPDLVKVYGFPKANFSFGPQPTTMFNPKIFFKDLSTGDPVSWDWNFGDPNGDSSYSTLQHPVHIYSDTGKYKVTLTVVNQYGCKDVIEKYVVISPTWSFYIPNTFTPNGDGRNDGFIGKSTGVVEHQMWIFDRWGNMVYTTNKTRDPESAVPWDGRANGGGDIAQMDTYVWLVVLKNVFGEKHRYIGHVNIVK